MAERRIIFPDDHPVHPGKSLVIPEDATQEQVDEVLNSFSGPSNADTAVGYGKTIASAVPKIATNLIGGAAAGATTLGGIESPSAALSYKDPFKGKGPPKSLSDVWERMTTGGGQNIPEPPNPAWLTNRATETLGLHTPQTPGEKIADVATQGVVGTALG